MKTIYDIQQYLKKFGTIIYIGDRLADLEMMEEEVRELYQAQCMPSEDYQMAILLLRSEMAKQKDRQTGEEKR
ncbi:YqgQ family protein [Halobacillus sp. Nhm2S1]|uniref:YqgQ family protein n=1 Tax=Halobacillus sp. Nhm2S1 TaxID=2866716 RepID=UPI001C72AF03|nr:YqgQ family protein [Halobacillus sp. Nhm2S1]MBX0358715.1 YqgQ family protein [Halobacillus sp. Nhm2S1]